MVLVPIQISCRPGHERTLLMAMNPMTTEGYSGILNAFDAFCPAPVNPTSQTYHPVVRIAQSGYVCSFPMTEIVSNLSARSRDADFYVSHPASDHHCREGVLNPETGLSERPDLPYGFYEIGGRGRRGLILEVNAPHDGYLARLSMGRGAFEFITPRNFSTLILPLPPEADVRDPAEVRMNAVSADMPAARFSYPLVSIPPTPTPQRPVNVSIHPVAVRSANFWELGRMRDSTLGRSATSNDYLVGVSQLGQGIPQSLARCIIDGDRILVPRENLIPNATSRLRVMIFRSPGGEPAEDGAIFLRDFDISIPSFSTAEPPASVTTPLTPSAEAALPLWSWRRARVDFVDFTYASGIATRGDFDGNILWPWQTSASVDPRYLYDYERLRLGVQGSYRILPALSLEVMATWVYSTYSQPSTSAPVREMDVGLGVGISAMTPRLELIRLYWSGVASLRNYVEFGDFPAARFRAQALVGINICVPDVNFNFTFQGGVGVGHGLGGTTRDAAGTVPGLYTDNERIFNFSLGYGLCR